MQKIGIGYDIHKLVEGRKLILGGVEIPFEKGPLGHSDGDALLHAVADALLGAAGLGDIGYHFPDTDPDYKDADSAKLLGSVVDLIRQRGYRLVNLDANIIIQKPKLAPFIAEMKNKMAVVLNVEPEQLSIKIRSNEGLDAIGRGEAVAAQAIALISK
jgi:2-C-methyl-D-erythritol 2,4-cyclodiphosphate synthase